MVKLIKGNLFGSEADIIAHGVNTSGGFGSGIAGQIATFFPEVRALYFAKYEKKGWKLGDVQFAPTDLEHPQIIANCATQEEYYPRNKVHADYGAVLTCMEKVKNFAKANDFSIAIPKIGCGLAGGDWNIVHKILEEVFDDHDIRVYYVE